MSGFEGRNVRVDFGQEGLVGSVLTLLRIDPFLKGSESNCDGWYETIAQGEIFSHKGKERSAF